VPPCAARIRQAEKGTVPGGDVADYSYCLKCPDSAITRTASNGKQNRADPKSKGRYTEKPEVHICDICKEKKPFTSEHFPRTPANKFGLAYQCIPCTTENRRKNKASEWQRR